MTASKTNSTSIAYYWHWVDALPLSAYVQQNMYSRLYSNCTTTGSTQQYLTFKVAFCTEGSICEFTSNIFSAMPCVRMKDMPKLAEGCQPKH
jgi:hypothetical protein